ALGPRAWLWDLGPRAGARAVPTMVLEHGRTSLCSPPLTVSPGGPRRGSRAPGGRSSTGTRRSALLLLGSELALLLHGAHGQPPHRDPRPVREATEQHDDRRRDRRRDPGLRETEGEGELDRAQAARGRHGGAERVAD